MIGATVWIVAREYDGLAGVGGVKDVSRQLAEALAIHGKCKVRVVLPFYGFMDNVSMGFEPVFFPGPLPGCRRSVFAVDMNYPGDERREQVSFRKAHINGVTVYLVDAKRFREKSGVYTYTEREENSSSWKICGMGHYDYFPINILLQKAALDLMILLDERPDVIHCQDGHAATLAPMVRQNEGYRHFFSASGLVVTIHNAGSGYHQDIDDLKFAQAITGLPAKFISNSLLGKSFDPFIAASDHAVFNTVSENYAWELRETPEDSRTGWLGHKLMKRGVYLEGVTNGINPADFDPMQPEKLGLPAPFDPSTGNLAGKLSCKKAMLQALHDGRDRIGKVIKYGYLTDDTKQPLLTFIGRLTHQKGVDVLVDSLIDLLSKDKNFQVLLLGSGSKEFEDQLVELLLDSSAAGRVCFLKGYDPDIAARVYAAGDFFLIPSLYEPCGLTDYIAQLLGNIPIVHHVGGLVKVVDRVTGFAYQEHEALALSDTIKAALQLYRYSPKMILKMQQAAVQRIHKHHTWKEVMTAYMELYSKSIELICHD